MLDDTEQLSASHESSQQLVLGFLAQFSQDDNGTVEEGCHPEASAPSEGQKKPGRVDNGIHTGLFLDGRGFGKPRKVNKGDGELDHQRDGQTLVRTFRLMSGAPQKGLDDEIEGAYIPDSEEMFPNSCVHFHKFYHPAIQLMFGYFREQEWLFHRELLKPHDPEEMERLRGALHVVQGALIFMITNLEL